MDQFFFNDACFSTLIETTHIGIFASLNEVLYNMGCSPHLLENQVKSPFPNQSLNAQRNNQLNVLLTW
jgi:hypothetical protein